MSIAKNDIIGNARIDVAAYDNAINAKRPNH